MKGNLKRFLLTLLLVCSFLSLGSYISVPGGIGVGTAPLICIPASASGTAYTCTPTLLDGTAIPSATLTTPNNGQQLIFVPDVTNTGVVTVQIDGVNARSVRNQASTQLAASDLVAGRYYTLTFNLATLRFLTSGISGPVNASNIVTGPNIVNNGSAFVPVIGLANSLSITGQFTKYNNINTVGGGLAAEYAQVDLTAQTAAITATALFTPATGAYYRVSYYAKVTTPGTTSILGGTTGLVLTFTDGSDSVAQTAFTLPETSQTGNTVTIATGNTTNTTQATLTGSATFFALNGVGITYAFGYTSTGTVMQYELHIRLEQL